MMKQQPFVTTMQPSKICRLLLLALALKLTVLGLMLFSPATYNTGKSALPSSLFLTQEARAAEGAGAPPAIPPIVPENPANAPALPTGGVTPLPGITQKETPPAPTDEAKNLPSVGGKTVDGSPDSALNKDALMRRQEELTRKEEELRALEKDVTVKLEQMTVLESRLSSMIKQAEDLNDAKLRHLIDVMSNMKARSAAEMLETMDQRLAVKVLAGMRGRQAGEILNFVKPEIAANLTAALTRMQLPFE